MALESVSLEAADAADTDLEEAELAVLVDLGAGQRRKGGDTRCDDRARFQEAAARDWRKGMTLLVGLHNGLGALCTELEKAQGKDSSATERQLDHGCSGAL